MRMIRDDGRDVGAADVARREQAIHCYVKGATGGECVRRASGRTMRMNDAE